MTSKNRRTHGNSFAFLGCGPNRHRVVAPHRMRGAERVAGLRPLPGPPPAGSRHQLASCLHAAAACRGRAERGCALPRAHRPQRRPASAGEAGLSRAHLHHARDARPLHAHAEGQRAHPGKRRRVPHQDQWPSHLHRPASRPRAGPAALHPGRRRAGGAAVPARQAA